MLDFIKTKNICGYKKAIKGVKNKQKSKQEIIFANHMSEKGFIVKKILSLQLNSKMKNNLIFKWAKDMNRHFFKEDLQNSQ